MDTARIIVKQLEINCILGCGEPERASPQRIEIDLEMEYDISAAAQTDDINQAVNYFEVCKRVTEECQERKFYLVEKLANDCSEMILLEYPKVEKVRITVRKLRIIPEALNVGIIVERSRKR